MGKQTFARHGFLAVVLALAGAVGCGDSDSDSDTDNGGTDSGATTGGGGGEDAGDSTTGTANEPDAGDPAPEPKDIVDTAVAAGNFTVLAEALGKAGLVDALKGDGPFTVFAPTDDAFAKLPDGTLDKLTKEELTAILTYHVVASEVPSSAVKAGPVKMLSGISAFLGTEGGVTINGAKVTTPDIEATNGVIHVIDTVILPPNLVDAAKLAGGFSTLISAVGTAELGEALSDPEATLTVFAPTDDAFAKLPDGTVAGLTKDQLANILKYHVVAAQVLSTELTAGEVTMLNGGKVTVDLTDGVKINESKVVLADVVTTNGVIHVIDTVLLPE